jgi:signal transduction histidine kinase
MAASGRRVRNGTGFPWAPALLATALLLTLVLAWQAVDAARSHRAAAIKVLHDDATLAANEYLRRARYEVGYFAFYPALRIVTDARRTTGRLPDPGGLTASAPIAPLGFLRMLVELDPGSGKLTTSPPASGELAAWLDADFPRLVLERASSRGELAVTHVSIGGVHRTFVYGMSPASGEALGLGFEVDLAALGPSWQRAFYNEPILPEPIVASGSRNEGVFLDLLDPWGRSLLRSTGQFDAASGASRTVAGASDILAGLTVRASIAPAAARSILAGGLPASRLPLLAATTALAAGLLAAAFILWRRERELQLLREDFVSGVSHELRTPLAQIRLFAETLRLDRVRTPDERRRSLEIIDQEARRLSQLVENTLVFSRFERGTAAISPRTRDVAALIRSILEGFAPLAAAYGARIEVDLPARAEAPIDEDALRQVLVNLLDNAVKYGPVGQRIAVGLAQENGWLRILVEDEGPGVPRDDRERIFERFVRLERDRQTHTGGTGIGLSVARDLVLLHGGVLRAESAAGGGARFVIELPGANRPETSP